MKQKGFTLKEHGTQMQINLKKSDHTENRFNAKLV